MNHRLTIAAAVAVVLASISEWVLIQGASWLFASIGAVIVIALVGTLTRGAPTYAAIGATALAALASVPLLADSSIWLKVVGVLLIAICAASITGARVLRPLADAITYLAALLLYLNLTLSHAKSIALLIPTAKSLHHLTTLSTSGMNQAKLPPPVMSTPGVVLLAAASIGLAAIVVDIVAVRMQKPAIAGLPLLVIFMAPIATAAKASGPGEIITFLLAATGYLGLLASDGRHRLRGWGRIVTVWHYAGEDDRLGGADMRGLAATGRRIGMAAVCAAVVAPLLLPSLNLHRLFVKHTGGTTSVSVGLPSPLVQLGKLLGSPTNAHVLTYRTAATTGQYLQVYALNYDPSKDNWSLIRPTSPTAIGVTPLKQPQGIAPTVEIPQITTQVKLGAVSGAGAGFASSIFFLPVPYFPLRLSIGSSWSASINTGMVYSGIGDHADMSYTVTSGQPEITPTEEAAANGTVPTSIAKEYGSFKSPVSEQLLKVANAITKHATSQFEKAQALEAFFQHGFTYTLKTDLADTPQGLLQFVTTDKRGFCEQFAFAMAAMARLEGIPSRIAVGYTSGTQTKPGLWNVTTADAHAWPELYFSGLGWVRFEPTPGGTAGQGTAVQPSYGTPAATGGSGGTGNSHPVNPTGPTSKPGTSSITSHVKEAGPGTDPLAAGSGVTLPGTHSRVPLGQILLALLIVLLLVAAVPSAARVLSRRRRWRQAADDTMLANAAWQEICADLDDFGIARRASESPRAIASRISTDVDLDEGAREAIRRIATVVERCRYAPTPATANGVRADVTQVRRSLARSSTKLTRLKASLMPASTIFPFTHNLRQSLGQATGWMPSTSQS